MVEGDVERGKCARAISLERMHVEAVGDVVRYYEGRRESKKSRYLEKELHIGNGLLFRPSLKQRLSK